MVNPLFLVPIALIVVVTGPVQFIECAAAFCVIIDIVLDSIINKLQCSMLCVKKTTKKVTICMITSILIKK